MVGGCCSTALPRRVGEGIGPTPSPQRREVLSHHMASIAKVARALRGTVPGIAVLSMPKGNIQSAALITAATVMARKAEISQAVLVENGLRAWSSRRGHHGRDTDAGVAVTAGEVRRVAAREARHAEGERGARIRGRRRELADSRSAVAD